MPDSTGSKKSFLLDSVRKVDINDQSLLKPGIFWKSKKFKTTFWKGHDSLADKHIRIEEPFDGTNTARAVFNITNYVQIKFTFMHVAKVLKRAQEAGADLYDLLEKEIKPLEDDMEVTKEVLTLLRNWVRIT